MLSHLHMSFSSFALFTNESSGRHSGERLNLAADPIYDHSGVSSHQLPARKSSFLPHTRRSGPGLLLGFCESGVKHLADNDVRRIKYLPLRGEEYYAEPKLDTERSPPLKETALDKTKYNVYTKLGMTQPNETIERILV